MFPALTLVLLNVFVSDCMVCSFQGIASFFEGVGIEFPHPSCGHYSMYYTTVAYRNVTAGIYARDREGPPTPAA